MRNWLTQLRRDIHNLKHWQAEYTLRTADGEVLRVEHRCACGMRKQIIP